DFLPEALAAHCLISAAVSRAGCEKARCEVLSEITASPISRASVLLRRSSKPLRASFILAVTCARSARMEASRGDRLCLFFLIALGNPVGRFCQAFLEPAGLPALRLTSFFGFCSSTKTGWIPARMG